MVKILVPVDLSDCSENDCLFGINLAEKIGAEFHLLHCFTDVKIPSRLLSGNSGDGFDTIDEEFAKCEIDARERLEGIISGMEALAQKRLKVKVPIIKEVVKGYPSIEIVNQCNLIKPDLLLLSTKSAGDKIKKLFGSLTYHIVNSVTVPVLTVPENISLDLDKEINICFVCDLTENEIRSVNRLIRIISGFKIKITILHVGDIKGNSEKLKLLSEFDKILKRFYGKKNIVVDFIETEDKVEGIMEFAKMKKIDIVSLTTAKKNFFSKLFYSDTAKSLLFEFNKPLLIFPS